MKQVFSWLAVIILIGAFAWTIVDWTRPKPDVYQYDKHLTPGPGALVPPRDVNQVQLVHIGGLASLTCWLYYPDATPVMMSDAIPKKDQNEFRVWCK